MSSSKKTTKTTKTTVVKLVKLDGVKVGRNCVYMEGSENVLRVGPTGPSRLPVEIAMAMDPAARRKFRKALTAAGHADLAVRSIPPKPKSNREIMEYAKARYAEIHKFTKGRYAENDHGDTTSHNA